MCRPTRGPHRSWMRRRCPPGGRCDPCGGTGRCPVARPRRARAVELLDAYEAGLAQVGLPDQGPTRQPTWSGGCRLAGHYRRRAPRLSAIRRRGAAGRPASAAHSAGPPATVTVRSATNGSRRCSACTGVVHLCRHVTWYFSPGTNSVHSVGLRLRLMAAHTLRCRERELWLQRIGSHSRTVLS
jgi:hypothetical protein